MNTTELKQLLANATPGPWTGHNMTHADHGRQMTPEEIGEYVCNSVKMGDPDRFLFVSAPHEDGGTVDVCHTGNGPRGQANTALIALAPQLAADNIELQAAVERLREEHASWAPIMNQRGVQVTKLEAENAKLRDRLGKLIEATERGRDYVSDAAMGFVWLQDQSGSPLVKLDIKMPQEDIGRIDSALCEARTVLHETPEPAATPPG